MTTWRELTVLKTQKVALAGHLSLTGRARTVSSEIAIDNLKKPEGVDTLLSKLDNLF